MQLANTLTSAGLIDAPELLALPQQLKVVLVMDLVESVRLMAANELAVVDHWRGFVRHAVTHVLPQHEGRMVKSLGDGIMVEFESPRNATNAAIALHRYFDPANAALPPDQQLYLRAGLNTAQVYIDDIDIYGSGVNLAARVASLAGPGETMVTAEVRDGLVDGIDGELEDMGDCHLKHVQAAVRVFRVGDSGDVPLIQPMSERHSILTPTLAVMPFSARLGAGAESDVGDLIADCLIARLGAGGHVKVISRLSAGALRSRAMGAEAVGKALGANYILSGGYVLKGLEASDVIVVFAELADVSSGQVLWSDRVDGKIEELLQLRGSLVEQLVSAVSAALLTHATDQCTREGFPNLQGYSLLLAAINLTHRQSRVQFMQAEKVLSHLCERYPRLVAPRACLGKWHVLRVAQGWADQPSQESDKARRVLDRALNQSPGDSLALAISGLVHAYIDKDFVCAREQYDAALHNNPNESLAWLFRSALHAYEERGDLAVQDVSHAQVLSPLDPVRYYYDNFAITAWMAAGDYHKAVEFGCRSLRANRYHGSTLRLLTIARHLSGDAAGARELANSIVQQEPTFSIARFRERHPGRNASYFPSYEHALRAAGLPD